MRKIKIEFGFGIGYRGDGSALLEHEQVAGLREIRNRASALFGGHTLVNTLREWWDAEADFLVAEPGCTISVFVWVLDRNIDEMVQQIKASLHQKEVAVTRTEVQFDII